MLTQPVVIAAIFLSQILKTYQTSLPPFARPSNRSAMFHVLCCHRQSPCRQCLQASLCSRFPLLFQLLTRA
jgi:hypothetical protein